jgi:hypothetical protein
MTATRSQRSPPRGGPAPRGASSSRVICAHFATLTTADEWGAERFRREFLDGWVRRVAWHARNPVPWFAVIEKGPIGGRAHLHTLVAGTYHVSTEVLEVAWQTGNAQVRAYEPHRGAAFYVAKSVPDACEWYDLSSRRAPLLEHLPSRKDTTA